MSDRRVNIAAAWLAFMAGLIVGGEAVDTESVLISGVIGAVIVCAGYAAASRLRVMPSRAHAVRARLVLLAAVAGVALGLANLAANWLIAASHPDIRTVLLERFNTANPLAGIVAAPLVEEIGSRLFLMSGLAWLVSRFNGRHASALVLAAVGSSLLFALTHLDRPMPADEAIANLYRVELVAKYTVLAMPLAWVFWRWGLPYAIVCHALANATHVIVVAIGSV